MVNFIVPLGRRIGETKTVHDFVELGKTMGPVHQELDRQNIIQHIGNEEKVFTSCLIFFLTSL